MLRRDFLNEKGPFCRGDVEAQDLFVRRIKTSTFSSGGRHGSYVLSCTVYRIPYTNVRKITTHTQFINATKYIAATCIYI